VLLEHRIRAGEPVAASALARLARVWPDLVPIPPEPGELAWGWPATPDEPPPLPALLDVERILRDLA
jgi:hypothetical protein